MGRGRALLLVGAVGLLVVPGATDRTSGQCDELPKLDDVRLALTPPDVFELDTAALDDVLVEHHRLLANLAQQTDGELHDLVELQIYSQDEIDAAVLDGWEQDRVELLDSREETWKWILTAVGPKIHFADGGWVGTEVHSNIEAHAYERLVVECREPELADGPPVDTSEQPPAGTVVFFRADESGETGQLVSIGSNGEDEHDLPIQPDDAVGHLEALPTGLGGIVVGLHEGDEYRTVIVDRSGRELDSIQRADGQLVCPAWNTTADKVLALANTADRNWRKLHLLDLTGETPSRPLDLPFEAVSCGDFLDDDRLVVSDAALEPGDDRGVWTVGIDGTGPEQIYVADGCTTDVGSVAPDGQRVALAQTCTDPLDSGVWVLDLASGEARHIATGPAARPKWSTDGDWLVFGFRPVADQGGIRIWMARADGGQLRQLAGDNGSWASFPVWLPG